jgi:hypothetical protein
LRRRGRQRVPADRSPRAPKNGLNVTGDCTFANGAAVNINGNLNVADGAILNDHAASSATVLVTGNVIVG